MEAMRRAHITRRSILGAGICVGVSGCNNPVLENAGSVAKNLIVGYPDLALKRDAIAGIPYATMAGRLGRGGPQSLLILGRVSGRDQHWISDDRAVVVTRGGRVVKTYGFPVNLKSTIDFDADPVDRTLHLPDGPRRHRRQVVFDQPERHEFEIASTFETLGRERISIFDVELDTVLVRETNEARQVHWSFENLYWVDYLDGYVWQSRQHIARSFPPLVSQILKPPG